MAKDWTALLSKSLPRPCLGRPFVCEGLPDASQVIIIGNVSATDVPTDWWTYWHPEKGFDYSGYIDGPYRAARAGKQGEVSRTRVRLDRVRQSGIRAVETNVYRTHGAEKVSNLDVLRLLIANMSDLKAVVAHGEVAKSFLKEIKLARNVKIFRKLHFSNRKFLDADLRGLIEDLKAL